MLDIYEDVINCKLEYYDHKKHDWILCYLTNVFYRKYNKDAELEVWLEYEGKVHKLLLSYGRVLNIQYTRFYIILEDDKAILKTHNDIPNVKFYNGTRFAVRETNVADSFIERSGIQNCITNQLILQN